MILEIAAIEVANGGQKAYVKKWYKCSSKPTINNGNGQLGPKRVTHNDYLWLL